MFIALEPEVVPSCKKPFSEFILTLTSATAFSSNSMSWPQCDVVFQSQDSCNPNTVGKGQYSRQAFYVYCISQKSQCWRI